MIYKTQRNIKKFICNYDIHHETTWYRKLFFHLAKTMAKNKFNVAVFYPVFAKPLP